MPKHSVKDRLRYKDISWLMPSVDVETALDKLNVEHQGIKGDEIRGMCPDHHLFTGHPPSHPHWTVNIDTGETYCFTEGRGSNLVWIVSRLLDCKAESAARFLAGATGDAPLNLMLLGVKNRISRMRRSKDDEEEQPAVRGLDDIANDLDHRPTSQRLYDFFMHPPGKKETNIEPATVDHFGVFERHWGYYNNRAIIPYKFKGELIGFVAIDLLGEKEWKRKNPVEAEELGYRKTLYPLGFSSADCLGGFDGCTIGAEQLILVEDMRSRMKCWQEGFPNTASLNGAMLHGGQLQLISLLAPKEICVMLDGDNAGRMGTDKVTEKLLRNFKVRKCFPPWGNDPKHLDGNGIKNVLKKAKLAGN